MGASDCYLAKFRKRCLLFSMNEVKRLAKESLEIDVVEVIRQIQLKNSGRLLVVFVYSYYCLYYNFSWKKLSCIIFHLSGRFLNYFRKELFFRRIGNFGD